MQTQNDLAVNLMNLFNPNAYTQFEKGYFINQPKMSGYFYIFKDITKPSFCLILNNSDFEYESRMVKINDWIFIVYNVPSVEEFTENLGTKYFEDLIVLIDQNLNKENTRNLPYGYYYDENGELKINLRKAQQVRKIYNMYIETESVREIAQKENTNFSFIRDILHDNEEYMQMQQKILPMSILKKVNEILAQNVKGRFKKASTEDKIKEIQQRGDKLRQNQEMAVAQQQQTQQAPQQ